MENEPNEQKSDETQTKLDLKQGLADTRDNILNSETDKCFASAGLIDACENNPIIKIAVDKSVSARAHRMLNTNMGKSCKSVNVP